MVAARIGAAVFGLALSAIAALFALSEYRAFLQWSVPPSDLVAGVPREGMVWAPARSIRTEDEQMAACIRAYQSVMYRLADDEQRAALANACFLRAGAILDASPTRSAAHLARAMSAEERGDTWAALDRLRLSAATGANVGWLAYRRVRFGLALLDTHSDNAGFANRVLPLIEADVVVLATEPSLTPALASLYVTNEAAQDWMTALVEQQPPEIQRAFLARVRAVLQPAAGS